MAVAKPKQPTSDWGATVLVALIVMLALAGTVMFGNRLAQFHGVIVVVVLLLGVSGIYLMKKQD